MMRYGKDDQTDLDSLENTRRAMADAVHRELDADSNGLIPLYDALTAYAQGSLVIFPDGCIYQSQFDANINNDLNAMKNMVKFWRLYHRLNKIYFGSTG